MRAPELITDAEIRTATAIHTTDPGEPSAAGHQLWGNQTAKSQGDPAKLDAGILEIQLPSDDHVGLLQLIERIAHIKKDLPPDVVELRKNLSG
jgi:hypothetical protein